MNMLEILNEHSLVLWLMRKSWISEVSCIVLLILYELGHLRAFMKSESWVASG